MQIVESTLIAIVFVLWALRSGPYSGIIVFFIAIPFGMMAAFNLPSVGNTSIMTYDLVLLTIGLMLLLRTGVDRDVARLLGAGWAGRPLALFFCYAVVATLFFPRIFEGMTEVFSIGRVAGQVGIVSRPLAPGGGNLSQLVRMFLAILAFAVPAVVMIRRGDVRLAYHAILAMSLTHAALGLLDLMTQATGTSWIMAPIRTANYALTLGQRMAGLDRMIGGFPEASSYGYVSLGLLGFWLGYWFHNRTTTRVPLIMTLVSTFLVLRGTSSSAYVGAALLALLFIVLRVRDIGRNGDGKLDVRLAGALLALVAITPLVITGLYMMYALMPGFTDFIDRSLLNKLSSDSGIERMSWNSQAFQNFSDTLFLGAGLGSVRASNWVAAVLGTTGIVGFSLLLMFLWQMFRLPMMRMTHDARLIAFALKLGLAGCLSRALVVKATPNLDLIFFAMAGLLVGLAIHSYATTRSTPQRMIQW